MFNEVPARYDLLNRLLTLGIDQRWRRRASAACLEAKPVRVLDLCTGTGDLALLLASEADDGTTVLAADFSEPMVEVARRKAHVAGLAHRLDFRLADAGDLPFADGEIHAIGIAFAFRNLTYRNPGRDRYLSEMVRVLSPGGRLVIAETSQPSNGLWRGMFHTYMRALVGPLGGVISGHGSAYRYLASSVENYYRAEEVSEMLKQSGFTSVEHAPLLGGVAALHVAMR
jgi:demethylmenaquinone methyltransferase/2-methoxy-6-polyprenyl-1,4-benzoquinol methylase